MTQSGPSFSVITVTRNAARHIGACLKSVAAQDYAAVEHVIIDAASTDGTADLVARWARAGHKFVSEPDEGIYDAMNKGTHRASNDFVLFLGADDYLADAAVLADVAAFLRSEPACDLLYGDLEVRQPGAPATVFQPPPPEEALQFMIYGCLPHQSTLARRTLFDGKVGPFDTRYKVHGDYDWFLRAFAAEGVQIKYMNRRIGSFFAGATSSDLARSHEELCRIQNAFPRYCEPEWLERRLRAFQDQTLTYRLAAQNRDWRRSLAALGRRLGQRA